MTNISPREIRTSFSNSSEHVIIIQSEPLAAFLKILKIGCYSLSFLELD